MLMKIVYTYVDNVPTNRLKKIIKLINVYINLNEDN